MNVTCKIDLSSSEANKLFRGINSISELSDLYNPLFKLYHGYNISNSVMNVFMDSIESRYNKQGDLYSKLGIKDRLELEAKLRFELDKLDKRQKSIEENANKKVDHDRELSIDDNGLSLIFKNSSDITSFISFIKSKIISATIYNKDAKKDIITIDDLNDSILSLQNTLLRQLARSLGIEEESMYDKTSNGYKLNENFFKSVMDSARVRYNLNKDSETGLYDLSSGERSGFFTYLLLSNFDDLISKYTQISVDPILKGSTELFLSTPKYSTKKLDVKQEYDDFKAGDSTTNTSQVVKDYISTLEERNSENLLTGNYVQFKEFNSLIRIIKDYDSEIIKNLYREIREDPTYGIKRLFDKMNKLKDSIFKGNDYLLLNTFNTIYYNIFDDSNVNSLYSRYKNNSGIYKNNTYAMICNHINKMSSVTYKRIEYDKDSKKYVNRTLTNDDISGSKSDISKGLMAYASAFDYSKIIEDYKVSIDEDNTVSFTVGDYTFTQERKTLQDDELSIAGINNLKNPDTITKLFRDSSIQDFLKKVFNIELNKNFFEGLLISNNANLSSLLNLFRLASNILLVNEIQKINTGVNTITSAELLDAYANKLGLDTSRSRKWFRKRLIRVEGLDNGSLNAVELLAKGISYINRNSVRSNVQNSQGSSLSKYRITCLTEDDRYQFRKQLRLAGDKNAMQRYNLFIFSGIKSGKSNYEILNNYFKTEIVDEDGNGINISKLTAGDLLYDQFVFGFLNNRYNSEEDKIKLEGDIQIQPAVYADKGVITGKSISGTSKISYIGLEENGERYELEEKAINKLTNSDLDNLIYHTMRGQLWCLRRNIVEDYKNLFKELNTIYKGKYNIEGDLEYDEWENYINQLNEDLIYEAVKSAKNKGRDLYISPEVHYSFNPKTKRLGLNNTLRLYFKQYLGNKENYYEKKQIEDALYVKSLYDNDVVFSLYENGKENKTILDNLNLEQDQKDYFDFISNLYGVALKNTLGDTYKNVWVDNTTGTLRQYLIFNKETGELITDKDGEYMTIDKVDIADDKNLIVLNPDLRRFKDLDNLVSYNYNFATTGLSYLHPSKAELSKDIDFNSDKISRKDWLVGKLEEGARTINLNKRGVIYGATGHPFIKNKEDGIGQYLNIAVIKDIKAYDMGISQNNGAVDAFDGAIFINGLQAIWERNSLPEISLSPVHRKPIGYSFLDREGGSVLLKCATYTINNARVRESITSGINMENILRDMMSNTWSIPNLQLDFPTLIYSTNLGELGTYYRDSIKFKETIYYNDGTVDNIYTRLRVKVDANGKELGEGIKSEISINNNFDAWKALGGAYSCSFINGKLIESEQSFEDLAKIANKRIRRNDPLIAAYRSRYKIHIALGKANKDITAEKVITIPEKYLKYDQSINSNGEYTKNYYYQPMKYSDIHYLANASGVKNGMTNINPNKFYYNSIESKLKASDRVIFAMPTTGKTKAVNMGYDVISFEDKHADLINSKENYSEEEYKKLLFNAYEEDLETGKRIMFSNLDLYEKLKKEKLINKYIWNSSLEEFTNNLKNRGDSTDNAEELFNQYKTIFEKVRQKTDIKGHQLYEYLDNRFNSFEFDPAYLLIQLNAEHSLEDEEVSEMTQVISAMEQNAFTHDLAIQIFENIGEGIASKLNIYINNSEDINNYKNKLNRLLGKVLVTVFASREGSEISLASAFLEEFKKQIAKNSKDIPKIPFDDNNILGALETSFKSGFNKDIIKRHFPGFAAVQAPSHDLFSVYDYRDPNNGIVKALSSRDLLSRNGTSLKKVLASLDTEVTVDELEIGDWIEYNGEHKRVGTLFTEDPNTISLKELRFLDRFTKIKKLGSKGRNLRAQNIKVTIDNKGIQKLPTKFDQWDLDSVLFNHYTEYFVDNYDSILANPKDVFNATLIHSFEDLKNFVKTIYPESENLEDVVRKKDKVLLRRYGRMLIDRDMKALKEGKFKIPFRFKETLNLSNDIADIISSEYKANECAVGKPFANKFLLEEGDSLNDVSVTFFENKLKRREISSWTNNYYDVFLKSINGYEVHFSNVESTISSLKSKGYEIEEITPDTITNVNGEIIRRAPKGITYPFNENMKVYKVTKDGKTSELITNYTNDDIINIYSTNQFSGTFFNFKPLVNNIITNLGVTTDYIEDLIKNEKNEELEELNQKIVDNKYHGKLSSLYSLYKSIEGKEKDRTPVEILLYLSKLNQSENYKSLAKKMYRSFQEAIKIIAARIPAQSMQSFMNMKITSFLETESNIMYIPTNMLVYAGSDFDIDKVYAMYSTIGDNGVYVTWSPYFNFDNENLFELSKNLPLPDHIARVVDETGIDLSEYEDLVELNRPYNKKKDTLIKYWSKQEKFLIRFAEMIKVLGDSNKVKCSDRLLKLINNHSMFKYNKSDAVKNRMFNFMYKVGTDPRNFLAQNAILTVDRAREASRKSTSGKFETVMSNENPGAKMIAQLQNMVGKDCIGIYANGIKGFSSLSVYVNDKISNADALYDDLKKTVDTLKMNKDVTEQLIKYNLQSLQDIDNDKTLDPGAKYNKINNTMKELLMKIYEASNNPSYDYTHLMAALYDETIREEFLKDRDKKLEIVLDAYKQFYDIFSAAATNNIVKPLELEGEEKELLDINQTPSLPNINITSTNNKITENLKRLIDKFGLQEDVFEILGIMLNISTDNAKELVLNNINAAGELANIYIYLVCTGVDFDKITNFMISEEITNILKESKKSIFNKSKSGANLRNALKYFLDTPSIGNFVPSDFTMAASSSIKSYIRKNKLGAFKDGAVENPDELKFKEIIKFLSTDELKQIKKWLLSDDSDFKRLLKNGVLKSGDVEFMEEATRYNMNIYGVRYINALIKRSTIIDNNPKVEIYARVLHKISDAASEFSEYSQWCGINQGIKTKRIDYHNFVDRRISYIEKVLNDTGETINNSTKRSSYIKFDFYKFWKDKNYQKAMIAAYESKKKAINILEAIVNSPHFSQMYKALVASNDVMETISYKYSEYNNIKQKLYKSGIITSLDSKTNKRINRFIDDVVNVNFFNSEEGSSFEIQPDSEVPRYINGYIKNIADPFKLNTAENRASFKNIMERVIIPRLKSEFPGNSFLEALIPGFMESTLNMYSYLKLPISLNSMDDTNIELFRSYSNAFNRIRKEKIFGNTVEDLFFAYNILLNGNKFGPNDFTRIFNDSVRFRTEDSLIDKYSKFEANLNSNPPIYDIKDLYYRMADYSSNKFFTLSFEDGDTKVLDENNNELIFFTENNITLLPFSDGIVVKAYEKTNKLYSKLLDLLYNEKVVVKLTCDE